jgi:hypothetical protein
MAERVEDAPEGCSFVLFSAFCPVTSAASMLAERAKHVLHEQRRALSTRHAIRQQSPYFSGIARKRRGQERRDCGLSLSCPYENTCP